MVKKLTKFLITVSVAIAGLVSMSLTSAFNNKEVIETSAGANDVIYFVGDHNKWTINSPWCRTIWDGNNNITNIFFDGAWKTTNGEDWSDYDDQKLSGNHLVGKKDNYETETLHIDVGGHSIFTNGETYYIYYGDWKDEYDNPIWSKDGAHTYVLLISQASAEKGPSTLTLLNTEKLSSFRGDTEEENNYLSFTIPQTGEYYFAKILRTQNELHGTTAQDFTNANIWNFGYIKYFWQQGRLRNVYNITGDPNGQEIHQGDWGISKVTYQFAEGSIGTETITPKYGNPYFEDDGTTFSVTESAPRVDYVTSNDRIKGDSFTPKDGHVFDKITLDGSEVDFSADFTYDYPNRDLVFTIHSKVQAITIKYNKGAYGTGTEYTDNKTYNVDIKLRGAIFTRENYSQTGWSTSDGGEKAYELSETYSKNESLELYPYWTGDEYTVTFDPKGGTVEPTTKTVNYGSKYGELPTPNRANHTFNGWYDAETDGNLVNSETIVNVTSNHTLYAYWIKSSITAGESVYLDCSKTIPGGKWDWDNAHFKLFLWRYGVQAIELRGRNLVHGVPGNENLYEFTVPSEYSNEYFTDLKFERWSSEYGQRLCSTDDLSFNGTNTFKITNQHEDYALAEPSDNTTDEMRQEYYARYIMTTFTCDGSTYTFDAALWNNLKAEYNVMSKASQDAFKEVAATRGNENKLSDAAGRYDELVSKHDFENFADRSISPSSSKTISLSDMFNNSSMSIMIVVIALASLSSVGIFIVYRNIKKIN